MEFVHGGQLATYAREGLCYKRRGPIGPWPVSGSRQRELRLWLGPPPGAVTRAKFH